MKSISALLVVLGLGFAISASAAILTTDPLTGLPLDPATENRAHPGNNNPVKMPDTLICKSKLWSNFYSIFDSKENATAAWYAAHLPGFHKAQGYANRRPHEIFYNNAGTLAVLVMGNIGKEGENTGTYSVAYYHFEPGASAKTIESFTQGKMVCQ